MNMIKKRLAYLALAMLVVLSLTASCSSKSETIADSRTGAAAPTPLNLESRSLEKALASGKPTMADFGSTTCVPCKNMKAAMEALDPLYKDKINLVIVIVDDKANEESVAHYQIMSIPTQIFFNSAGKIIAGHVGEMSREDIVAQFKKMGID